MSCGVGCRCSSDPALLWLWHRPATVAPIQPLAWEPPYAVGVALEEAKIQKEKFFFFTGNLVHPGVAVSCGVGYRHSSDLALLWLWCKLAAAASIRPLAWELPYAACAAPKSRKKKSKKKWKKEEKKLHLQIH